MEPRPSTGSGQAFRGGDAAFAGLTQLGICGPSTRRSFPRRRESRPDADRFCESVLHILKIIPAALRATTDLPGAGCWLRYSGAVRASQELQTLTRRPALSTIHCVLSIFAPSLPPRLAAAGVVSSAPWARGLPHSHPGAADIARHGPASTLGAGRPSGQECCGRSGASLPL